MATVFWDMEGILLIECVKKGSTITGQVYDNHKHTAKKTHNSDKKIILLHDNCIVHKARQIREVTSATL
jgi:hypothetical protein